MQFKVLFAKAIERYHNYFCIKDHAYWYIQLEKGKVKIKRY